ncbi:hypothetical protein [Pseudoalteromonas luteoviolacea]|uniref:hypothetical protein n=1 Tax=Pseudoalteromonas luteoviolacea TaxID=43657 RepID=UPI00210E7FC0|nr:hypothetical protein [Pseudoalteromonas luteoviolacea]
MKKYAQILSLLAANLAHAKVDLLIDNATIISPINQSEVSIKTNHWVSISDGKIIEVSNNLTRPIANTMIDANGLFLIPGLTDSHTHLRTMPGLLKTDNDGKRMQSQFLKRQGANYLYYGVTQVIDPANTAQGIAEFNGQSFSPDAYFCGAMPIYQGYAARGIKYQNLHKHRAYYVHQHDDPSHLSTPAITSLHQAKTAVRRLKKDAQSAPKFL